MIQIRRADNMCHYAENVHIFLLTEYYTHHREQALGKWLKKNSANLPRATQPWSSSEQSKILILRILFTIPEWLPALLIFGLFIIIIYLFIFCFWGFFVLRCRDECFKKVHGKYYTDRDWFCKSAFHRGALLNYLPARGSLLFQLMGRFHFSNFTR